MDETKEVSKDNYNSTESNADIVVSKEDWIERAIEYEATPKSIREPQDKMTFIDDVCKVPRATYYFHINKDENQKRIIDICFKQAKKRTPEILEKLGKKAEDGNDTSIAQFMEYVLELKKKLDITSKDEPIKTCLVEFINGNSTNNTNTPGI